MNMCQEELPWESLPKINLHEKCNRIGKHRKTTGTEELKQRKRHEIMVELPGNFQFRFLGNPKMCQLKTFPRSAVLTTNCYA